MPDPFLEQYYYGYDAGSNRTTEQVDNAVKTSSYNNLNQLTGASAGGKTRFRGTIGENGTVTVGGQAAWMTGGTNFQADVNLTTGTNTIAVVATDASSNTRTNSYQVVIPTGGSTTVMYDANGNMLDDDTQTYSWDAKNRLVRTTYASGARTEYSYDVFGRRVKIVEKNSGGTVTSTKQFVFDGMDEVEQRDGSNAVTKRYFADGWRDVTGGASYFYTKDHLGSVREVVNGSGVLASRYDYDPYGRTTKVSGNVDSDMLYTGHYYDLPSGLYLTMFRVYNANLARWLSRDPLEEAEMLQGPNLYAYVANNPTNWTDPTGKQATSGAAGLDDDTRRTLFFDDNQEEMDKFRKDGKELLDAASDLTKDCATTPIRPPGIYGALKALFTRIWKKTDVGEKFPSPTPTPTPSPTPTPTPSPTPFPPGIYFCPSEPLN